MKEYKTVKKEVEILDKFICDLCGKDMSEIGGIPLDENNNIIEDYFETNDIDGYSGGSLEFNFGYFSKRDGNYYKGEICDGCFDKHFVKLLKKIKKGR